MTIKQQIDFNNLKHAVLIYNLMILKDWLFDKFVRNLFICYVYPIQAPDDTESY